jgi:peptidoglycan/xylan/chitin deacetylase (PgdA/CDA1 family)
MKQVATLSFAVLLATSAGAAEKRIALSFDDVPRHAGGFFTPDERAIRLIAALARAGVEQAGFFVTVGGLDRPDGRGGEDRIRAYAAAGHVIGNHSTSHPWLSRTELGEYLADIDDAEAWLRGRAGYRPWFRYPYLDEGRRDLEKRDAVRAALRERGLANAYVTVDNYDWHLDALASKAKREGRPLSLEGLRDLYVETLVQAAEFSDDIAVRALGRSPAHVLLLHETDLAALFVEDLVGGLRATGWEIVTLDEAYADPIAAREPDTWFLGGGRVAALAHEKGWEPRLLVHERTDEAVLDRLFAERVLAPAHEPAAPASLEQSKTDGTREATEPPLDHAVPGAPRPGTRMTSALL